MAKHNPCPFCNEADQDKLKLRKVGKTGYHVVCQSCGASGPIFHVEAWHSSPFPAQGKAIIGWNKAEKKGASA